MPSMEQVLNRTWLLSGEPIAQRKLRVCVSHDHSWLIPPTKLDSIVVVSSLYIHIIYSLLRTQQWNKLKRPNFRMLAVYQSSLMPLRNWIILQWLCSDQAVHFPIGDSDDDDSRSSLILSATLLAYEAPILLTQMPAHWHVGSFRRRSHSTVLIFIPFAFRWVLIISVLPE